MNREGSESLRQLDYLLHHQISRLCYPTLGMTGNVISLSIYRLPFETKTKIVELKRKTRWDTAAGMIILQICT